MGAPETEPMPTGLIIPIEVDIERRVAADNQSNLHGTRRAAYAYDIAVGDDEALNNYREVALHGTIDEVEVALRAHDAIDDATVFDRYYFAGTEQSDEESTKFLNGVISSRLHFATNTGILSGVLIGGGVVAVASGAVESNNYTLVSGILSAMTGAAIGVAGKMGADTATEGQESAIKAAKQAHAAKRITDLLRNSLSKLHADDEAKEGQAEAATEA